MRKRALLLGVLLVVVALTASGCLGGLFGGIIGGGGNGADTGADTVVNAFLDAWNRGNAADMKSRLASTVTFHPELFGGSEEIKSSDDLATGLLTPGSDMQIVEVGLVGSLSTQVIGDGATVNGDVLVKYTQDLGVEATLYRNGDTSFEVEDIYPMTFGLKKEGSSWKINYLKIEVGTRLAAIFESWMTFAEGIVEEDVDKVLSVCTDPFVWDIWDGSPRAYLETRQGSPNFDGVTSHDEWRETLGELFAVMDIVVFELNNVMVIELSATDGYFYGLLDVETAGSDARGVRMDTRPVPPPSGEPMFVSVTCEQGTWKLTYVLLVLSDSGGGSV